jgi:hypothetical protein
MQETNHLTLEIYHESGDRGVAERAAEALKRLVGELGPDLVLDLHVMEAFAVGRQYLGPDFAREVPFHPSSGPGRQSLLITSEDIGAQGWGWQGSCVVSKQQMESKQHRGGDPADILIHEWLHMLYGKTIKGHPVPNVDHAPKYRYQGLKGLDGEDTWHAWYRFLLGGDR